MTGPNGLPVATRARPPVQASRSAGVASDRVVGLDMGRMTGRSTCVAISRTIRSVKAPCWVEVPMRMVGCTRPTTSPRPMPMPVPCPGQHGGEVDRAGALDVVVEGECVSAVAVQNAPGVAGAEVLPVQERVGEELQRGGDVGVDEGVVGLLC